MTDYEAKKYIYGKTVQDSSLGQLDHVWVRFKRMGGKIIEKVK